MAGGPLFALLWWFERAERRMAQKENSERLVQLLTVVNQSANAVTEVTKAVAELRAGTKDSVTTLTQLIRSLRRTPK